MNKNEKQIKPMLCPVCGKFKFTELSNDDIESGDKPNEVRCTQCGWIYDLEQTVNSNLANQSNKLSLNDYKIQYQKLIKQNPKYEFWKTIRPKKIKHKCPVCGQYIFKDKASFDICPVCHWEDDGSDEWDDEDLCGPNDLPFKKFKERYLESLKKH